MGQMMLYTRDVQVLSVRVTKKYVITPDFCIPTDLLVTDMHIQSGLPTAAVAI